MVLYLSFSRETYLSVMHRDMICWCFLYRLSFLMAFVQMLFPFLRSITKASLRLRGTSMMTYCSCWLESCSPSTCGCCFPLSTLDVPETFKISSSRVSVSVLSVEPPMDSTEDSSPELSPSYERDNARMKEEEEEVEWGSDGGTSVST